MLLERTIDKEVSPGPGSYKVDKFAKENDGPKFGFGTDIKDKFYRTVTNSGPGPGFYNEKKVMGDGAPCYTMKSRKHDPSKLYVGKDAPGPGAYEPSNNMNRRSAPKFRFGRSSKSKL